MEEFQLTNATEGTLFPSSRHPSPHYDPYSLCRHFSASSELLNRLIFFSFSRSALNLPTQKQAIVEKL
jgi:hypothetical protein